MVTSEEGVDGDPQLSFKLVIHVINPLTLTPVIFVELIYVLAPAVHDLSNLFFICPFSGYVSKKFKGVDTFLR